MDPIIGGALIGTAGNILGGLFGGGNEPDLHFSDDQAWKQYLHQKEFAQHGLRWKVEDAKNAGLHPLAALGAQGTSYSPVSVGTDGSGGGHDWGNTLSNIGQDIGRAVSSTKTAEEKKLSALQIATAQAELDGKVIDNSIKAREFQNMSLGTPNFPPAPGADNFIPGQGNSNFLVKEKPLERTKSQPGRLAQEAGWRPDVSYARTDTGLTPVIPESLSESMEDDLIGKVMWRVRNQLVPNITGEGAPAKSQLPKGYDGWKWSHSKQEWQPAKKRYRFESQRRMERGY